MALTLLTGKERDELDELIGEYKTHGLNVHINLEKFVELLLKERQETIDQNRILIKALGGGMR